MFRKFLPFVAVALVLTVALGAFALKPAFAAFSHQTSTPGAGTTQNGRGPGGPGGFNPNDDYLAKALGISTTDLQTAYTKAQNAAIDQAVKDGYLTQTQADQLKANSSTGGKGMGMGRGMFGPFADPNVNFNQLLADALGITTDKLQAAQLSAEQARIDQAVTDGKLSQDQADLMKARAALQANAKFTSGLKTAIQNAYSEALKQAVTDGVITQAQADALLKDAQSNPGGFGFGMKGWGGFEMGGRDGMDGRGHGGMHGFKGAPNSAPNNAAPNTTPTYPTPSGSTSPTSF